MKLSYKKLWVKLVELDMNTNEQTVIYQSKTQEAINNAQFYKK